MTPATHWREHPLCFMWSLTLPRESSIVLLQLLDTVRNQKDTNNGCRSSDRAAEEVVVEVLSRHGPGEEQSPRHC